MRVVVLRLFIRILRKRWVRITVGVFVVFVVLPLLLYAPILNSIASLLVREDKIEPAEAIVVLSGDSKGERMITAVNLYKRGFGEKIVFWGGQVYWKFTYAELILQQLKENDIPLEAVIWSDEAPTEESTYGEALVNIRLMEENGIESFILVTSPYHTGRAGRVYEPLAHEKGMKMYVYPSIDTTVKLEGWWNDRYSAKKVYFELSKTLFYLFKF